MRSRDPSSPAFPIGLAPSVPPSPENSPFVTCSPSRAWWMVRLRLLCMVNRMALPVWLNRGAPATYTRPCLEDTTDVTVYPAEGETGWSLAHGLGRPCQGPTNGSAVRRTGRCRKCIQGRPGRCHNTGQSFPGLHPALPEGIQEAGQGPYRCS